jgi:3',5'-cyclic AMP phosphodiesterase CpdA
MIRLLHFSDVHVQLPDWRTRSVRALGPLRKLATVELWKGRGRLFEGAAATVRRIVRDAETLGADHVVLTGDLTQLGHPEEFALAREALGPLAADAARFTTLPGNHDRYPIEGGPNRLFEHHFPEQAGSDLPVEASGGLRVRLLGDEAALIVVDSAGAKSWPVWSSGHVTARSLRALEGALRAPQLAGRCKLVLVHHTPTRRGALRDWPLHDLRGASALLRVAAEGGAEAILCGHVHERFDDPPRPGRPRVICAGASAELGDEGYWDIRIDRGRIASATARRPAG